MANKTPEVGDRAQLDGLELTVVAVEPGGKAKVDLADEVAQACAGVIAEIRERYAPETQALQDKFDAAVQAATDEAAELTEQEGRPIPAKNFIKAKVAMVKAEMDMHAIRVENELRVVPRGTTYGVALKDLRWVGGDHEVWSVPGRFYAGHYDERGKFYRPSDPIELITATQEG